MSVTDAKALADKNSDSECLYQIVASSPSDFEQFNENETGDTDGDSLKEFIDGWGRPIHFIRWPCGFNLSDIQPNIIHWEPANPSDPNDPARVERLTASTNEHDPFDSRRIDNASPDTENPINPPLATGWQTFPLISSSGPDGEYGLVESITYSFGGNPYTSITIVVNGSTYHVGMGAPVPGQATHIDNFTNHQF
jgi:hypothetical protein